MSDELVKHLRALSENAAISRPYCDDAAEAADLIESQSAALAAKEAEIARLTKALEAARIYALQRYEGRGDDADRRAHAVQMLNGVAEVTRRALTPPGDEK